MGKTAASHILSFAGSSASFPFLPFVNLSVFRIICKKDAGCQLEESDPQTPTCANANITIPEGYDSFVAEVCQRGCAKSDSEEDDSKRCRFWRFVSMPPFRVELIFHLKDYVGTTKTCSLMTETQCTVFDPCVGHCHCGDQGCPHYSIAALLDS